MTRPLLALAGLLLAASPALAVFALPRQLQIVPVYGTPPSIQLSWTEGGDATYYNIKRAVDGGAEALLFKLSGGAATNLVVQFDEAVVPTSTYTYRVEACDATGCISTSPFTTAIRTLWPIEGGGHEVMHGFNEVGGWMGVFSSAVTTGFHMGVDLNKTTAAGVAANVVFAPRGGIVNDIRLPAGFPDDGAIGIRVAVSGGGFEYDTFNHIATTAGNTPPVAVGDVVVAGQAIARIGVMNTFSGNFAKHVHFMQERSPIPAGQQRIIRHPLAVFVDPADRDPMGKAPALTDENKDTKVVLYRNHTSGNVIAYDPATTPLSGDVDVEPEVVDEQGTDPGQAPIDIGYWVEGPLPETEQHDDVKSAAKPYRLYDFREVYFGGIPGTSPPTPCNLVSDIADLANAGCGGLTDCTTRPTGACTSVIKEGATPWPYPVLHHFIVTHAKGETGARADVDVNQFWRTAAKDDGQPVGSTHANYAGQPTTTKAWEARFPDGDYTIHVVASDLVHANVDLKLPPARLENFAPFVTQVRFGRDIDANAGSGLPGLPGCELLAHHYRHTPRQPLRRPADLLVSAGFDQIARSGHKVCVEIRFSEPVANVVVDLVGQRGTGAPIAGSAFTGAAAKTNQDADTWTGTLILPADPTGASDSLIGSDENDVALRIRANDRRDAGGVVRTLDADGDGAGDPADVSHVVLRLDTSPPSASLDVVKP